MNTPHEAPQETPEDNPQPDSAAALPPGSASPSPQFLKLPEKPHSTSILNNLRELLDMINFEDGLGYRNTLLQQLVYYL